jgi:hypothetical protein
MKRGMGVLRSACLTLGLLMAVGSSASAQCQCTLSDELQKGVLCSTVDFGGVLIGNANLITIPVMGAAGGTSIATASISGPNAVEFSIVSPPGGACGMLGPTDVCNLVVAFTPLGCGTRMATLTVGFGSTTSLSSCTVQIPLVGFGCSFPCAINATQTATGLSPTVRDRILRELFLAQVDAATRCFHLMNCALCLAQPEALRARAGAQAVVDQILCLLVAFCSPPLVEGA